MLEFGEKLDAVIYETSVLASADAELWWMRIPEA